MAKDDKTVNLNFKVTADTTNLDDVADKVKQVMEKAVKKTQIVNIDADTSEAEGKISGVKKRIDLINRNNQAVVEIKATSVDAEKTINELQDKLKGLSVKLDTSKFKSQLNSALQELNNDEKVKKLKLGVNSKALLTEVNRAITSINNDESLKKLKLGVDSRYLQTQLNKAVKDLDATVKLKTKLETSSRKSDTKGTVTTTKTSKEEANTYKSLFDRRASAIQNMDKAYQEFGRDSQELRGAFKEFLSASREMRKFGRDTGVLSLNKINSDLERLIGANLSNNFVKNALTKERDKILRDRDALDRTLNPDKYARLEAKERVNQLKAEHGDSAATRSQMRQEAKAIFDSLSASLKDFSATIKQITGEVKKSYADQVNSKYNPNAIKNNMFSRSTYDQVFNDPSLMNKDLATGFVKLRKAEEAAAKVEKLEYEKYLKTSAKEDLSTMSHMAKASGIFNEEDFTRFKSRLEEYRSLIDNFNTNFYKKIGKELGITDESHPFYKELQSMYQKEKATDKKWDEQPVELANKEADAQAKVTGELKSQSALLKDKIFAQKQLLADLAKSAKEDKVFDKDKAGKFFEELQAYRDLTQNYSSSFLLRTGKQLGITNEHPYFAGMKTAFESARKQEQEWYKKPITAEVDVKGGEKLEEVKQKTLTVTQQFMRLRGEALKAGNALNQATDPKEITRLTAEFQKAIQALVNYQRATRGLTKGGEAQLVEKLAVGNIKEQTEAWKVLYEWVKKTVQAQRDYDIGVGRRNPPKSKDTDLMSYFKNLDWGRAVSGMAYAARGELNTIQSFGNLLSSLSQISGVVGVVAKGLGAVFVAGLAVFGVLNAVTTAFTTLTGVLGQVANTIYDILRPGVELYKQRQTAELAVAAAISSRATEGGERVSFERGLDISKELMQRVIIDAAKSAFNPQELIDALRGTLPLAFGKGMNLEQAYDLTKGVASVAKVINLAPNQVLQELRDILQGTISARSSQVAGATGMTGEELREAEAQGKLYEYISEHLKNFTIALNKYAETLAGALDRLSETWAMGMEAVFSKIAPIANNLLNAFVDNFIGVYKDKQTGEIIDTSNSENLKNPETGEYRELVPEFSVYIQQFATALEDLITFIAPIVDEILEFVQELTGQADPINAVKVLIEYAIRITVTLGEVLVQAVFDMAEALTKWEKPLAWLFGLLKGIVKATYHMDEALLEFGITIQNVLFAIWKAITRIGSWDDVGKAASEGMNNVTESSKKMMEDIRQGLTTTSYDELLGVDRGDRAEKGLVERLVDEAREKAQAEQDKKAGQPVDYSAVQGMAKENKQNLADLRKAMQAQIEDIKQALKETLAELKDIAERNELAYRQGYKSIEDYFSQKAELELREAQEKLSALQKEYALVAALDTGTDEGAKYQKDRDLIRLNGEMVLQQREVDKKQGQALEILGAIRDNTSVRLYQQGLQVANQGGVGITATSTDNLGQAMLDLANSAEWAEKEMYHAGEGCVEFVTTFGANFSNLLKEAADNQVWGMTTGTNDITPWLESNGVTVDYNVLLEDVLKSAKVGDILAVNGGKHAAIYVGDGMVLHNSSSSYENGEARHIKHVPIDTWDDETVNILRTSATMGDSVSNFNTAVNQMSEQVDKSTKQVQDTQKAIAESYQEVQTRMPLAEYKLTEEYYNAVYDGQTRMLEAAKNLALTMNDMPLEAVGISVASVYAKLKRDAEMLRAKFANIPALADALDKMFPIEMLRAQAKTWEQMADNRIKWIEDDAKGLNKQLREKTMLFPQAISRYFEYFNKTINDWTITQMIQNLENVATQLAQKGAIADARNIVSKILDLRGKFADMIHSWLDEMNNYFNYRRELVDADTGTTNFVKEERRKQFDKGQARVNAVAYAQEAAEWANIELEYQEKMNKAKEQDNRYEEQLAKMGMERAEQLKVVAERQAEINKLKGEEKTLWQETMDAANQALEDGLYKFMTDYVNTAESVGEAFRNLAIDILSDLQKFFAKKAITDLMHVITGEPNEKYNAPDMASIQTAENTGSILATMSEMMMNSEYETGSIISAMYQASNRIASALTASQSVMGTVFSNGTGGANSIANQILSNRHAQGGYISGAGTSTSDSIPAMLSNGEYVIKADAVRRYGLNFLNAVNSGAFTRIRTHIPHFAEGGYVGDALQDTARGITDFAKNIGTSVSTNNDISIALVRDEQEAIREWAKSPSGGQKFLVDFAKGNGRVFSRFNR